MIFRLLTWPARKAWTLADDVIWMARAAAEMYGYGLAIGGPRLQDEDWDYILAQLPGEENDQ